MRYLVFFLEEPSAREMLKDVVCRLLPDDVQVQFVVFEGKQDLEKRLPLRLRAWRTPNTNFVIVRDQDNGNCIVIKHNLARKCANAGRPDALVRIACRELESFYLGDLDAVARGFDEPAIARHQQRRKFRAPDLLGNPSQELKRMVPAYQKIAGSRAIAPHLRLDGSNQSRSFNVLLSGIRHLVCGSDHVSRPN